MGHTVFRATLEKFARSGDDRPQLKVRHSTARGKDLAVEVTFDLGHRLWPSLMVFSMTPEDALASSIDLQKAAIDARQCKYRGDVGVGGTKWLSIG
jgi:hypothetical protein